MTKLGETMYTPEQASELIGGIYSAGTLKNYATKGLIPHHGGRGKGKLTFSESQLQQILDTTESKPDTSKGTKKARKLAPVEEVELPDFFRQTSRSKARHRKTVA